MKQEMSEEDTNDSVKEDYEKFSSVLKCFRSVEEMQKENERCWLTNLFEKGWVKYFDKRFHIRSLMHSINIFFTVSLSSNNNCSCDR